MQRPLFTALLLSALFFFGCGKSDTPEVVEAWTITHFKGATDKDGDETLYTGYTFEFNDPNLMVIHAPGGSTLLAKWALHDSDTKFTTTIDNPQAPVDGLIGQWVVEEYTTSSIKLKKEPIFTPTPNAANQGEELSFTKQ